MDNNNFESVEVEVENKKNGEVDIRVAQRRDWFLPASILVAALMISGSIVYLVKSGGVKPVAGQPSANLGAGQAVLPSANLADVTRLGDRDVIMGSPDAPVTIVEYADFQCPFCGRFYTGAAAQIREQYVKTNKVKMVYRDFAFLGAESTAAAESAECAKDQGKFWAYHDVLYNAEIADGQENNGNLNRALFVKLAGDAGMDAAAFGACVDANKYSDVVKKAVADAQNFEVNSTPTIFVGGEKIMGAQPFNVFQTAIDKALGGG
ncbi:MAG: thioredoxin domain-containing protein [Candidatus Liptonbacteria bacterium]|nr:thioredoxin domain-containing protein [Candidatus Liptonbacteria bacterium]